MQSPYTSVWISRRVCFHLGSPRHHGAALPQQGSDSGTCASDTNMHGHCGKTPPGGGVLEIYMMGGGGGGSDGPSYCKSKKIHKPENLDPKKNLASKFPTQKKN